MQEHIAEDFTDIALAQHGPLGGALCCKDRAADTATIALSGAPVEECVAIPIGATLADAERCIIMATLRRCGGNKTKAAAVLGVSLKTLYNRLNDYRLSDCGSPAVLSLEVST
jgi:DNA-binding NtrC family response regulator